MGCNPTTIWSGRYLWPPKKCNPKDCKRLAEGFEVSEIYRGHPTGKAGDPSKSPGTGQEETSASAFNSSSGIHKFMSGSTIQFSKSTWAISGFEE